MSQEWLLNTICKGNLAQIFPGIQNDFDAKPDVSMFWLWWPPPSPSLSQSPLLSSSPYDGAVYPPGIWTVTVTGWIPTRLWLRAKGQKRREAERREAGCFPSASYPGKIPANLWESLSWHLPQSIRKFGMKHKCLWVCGSVHCAGQTDKEMNSFFPHEVFLLFDFPTMSPV